MSSPVAANEVPSKRRCVLVIGIDGCRPDCLTQEFAPNIYKLMHTQTPSSSSKFVSAYSLKSQVGDICWSGPGWCSVATGVWRDKHGVSGNTFATQQFKDYPSIFQRIKTADPTAVTACSINWKPLAENILLPCDFSNIHEENDPAVVETACKLLTSQQRLDCLFVHLDDVDLQGHTFDYGPSIPEYVESVKRADARVATLLSTLFEQRPFLAEENWLVAITTDHGGIDYTHEDGRPENRTNFLILHGDDVVPGEIFPSPIICDVAPTVLAHLNIKIKSSWHFDGRPVGLKLTGQGSFMCLESSQDPLNRYPIPAEELAEGPTDVVPAPVAAAAAVTEEEAAKKLAADAASATVAAVAVAAASSK